MLFKAIFTGLLSLFGTAALAQTGAQYQVQFQEPFSDFENCLLESFVKQSPITFIHVEIADSLHYGFNRLGDINRYRLVVPLIAVTETNHPAYLELNLSSAFGRPWTLVSTGGLPIFLTPAVLSPVQITNHVTGERVFTIWQDCGMPK